MDNQEQNRADHVKGNNIVIITCMTVITVLLAVLLANLPFGTVG